MRNVAHPAPIGLDRRARLARDERMKPALALLSLIALALLTGCASLSSPGAALTNLACQVPRGLDDAARVNRTSLTDPAWAPFGRPETGWSVYAPKAGHEIKTRCAPKTQGFAGKLSRWQSRHDLPATGAMDQSTFQTMKTGWQQKRPFVVQRAAGLCPDPPPPSALVTLPASETLGGKTVQLRADAQMALEQMVAAAHRDLPDLPPDRLTVFSGYRDPAYDAQRCASEGNCDGVGRATCSAHRTGLAVDLNLGAAPGFEVDSTKDANRLWQTRTEAYRWLIANAGRFGFVNYAFEPWHWEWKPPAS